MANEQMSPVDPGKNRLADAMQPLSASGVVAGNWSLSSRLLIRTSQPRSEINAKSRVPWQMVSLALPRRDDAERPLSLATKHSPVLRSLYCPAPRAGGAPARSVNVRICPGTAAGNVALFVSPYGRSGRNADRRWSEVRRRVAVRRAVCCHEPWPVPCCRGGLAGGGRVR
jgi:hypothetical protein